MEVGPLSYIVASIGSFREDVRFAARQFRRAPAYAIFTTLVLALGIGTVTAMFTISYGVLMKPLPFRADRQLFYVAESTAKGDDLFAASYPEITQWQQATTNIDDIAFAWNYVNIIDAPAGAEMISSVTVSPNLFTLLGVEPIIGRGFLPNETISDHPNVVLLSYDTWQRSFAGNRNVLGKTVHIGATAYSVMGVMPKQFRYPLDDTRAEVWVPVERSALVPKPDDPYGSPLGPIVRLHAGVRPEAFASVLARVHSRFVKSDKPNRIRLVRLRDDLVRDVQPALLALEIAVAIVWLIACSNVAGLLLARVAARRTEIAVRSALGAGRRRMVAQFLTESLLLSTAAAVGGLGIAALILRILRHILTTALPMAQNVRLDWSIFAGLVVLTLLTALAFGTVPALLAAWAGTEAGLRNSGRSQSSDRRHNRARAVLLVSEVALSIALLTGAGLMMRTMYALRHVPLGFRTDHLLVTSLTAPGDLYRDQDIGSAAWQPLLDAVRQHPAVKGAALSTVMPLKHPVEWLTLVYKTNWTEDNVTAVVRAASPGLMDVLGIRMHSGRFFNSNDTASSIPVAVVNRVFVDRYLGGGDALGKQFRYGRKPVTATVIGVIDDIHQDSLTETSRPEFYICIPQIARDNPLYLTIVSKYMEIAIRTEVAPGTMVGELRRQISEVNPHLAIGEFSTMTEAVEDSIGAQKLAAGVVGVFGGLALLITLVGLYGLLTYMVEQRTREIGIRMALGADRAAVIRLIIRQALLLMSLGAAAGVCIALWSNRLLHAFLYGVTASDPWALALAPLVLVLCGLVAAAVPARRAAGLDPVDALRAE
ncbi:MAG TPA: ABC transporter permease [Terracidiphilus sp.]|nr:ABC transporter permease [Terracidiphilus sp.]